MSRKFEDNCWADMIKQRADYEYLTDLDMNQFLVFDRVKESLIIWTDYEDNTDVKRRV